MKTNVRQHLRRTQTGSQTSVIRHDREIGSQDRGINVAQSDIHAKHSAIREALESVGDKLKLHRQNVQDAREAKAKANLESEQSEEIKRQKEAEQRLAHERKLEEIKKIEDEVKRLKNERFSHSLLGRTLSAANNAGKAIGRGTIAGSKLVYAAGSKGYDAIEKISAKSSSHRPKTRGYSQREYLSSKRKEHHKKKKKRKSFNAERELFS